jgi:hypothetical protein
MAVLHPKADLDASTVRGGDLAGEFVCFYFGCLCTSVASFTALISPKTTEIMCHARADF